jgi:hypothetical protein
MKADTIDMLTAKGHFPTEQALALAEAIDMAIRDAQLVTVPILDARFLAHEARMDARFVILEAKMDARFATYDAKLAALESRLDQKFERLRLQLIIAILLGYGAMGPLGAALLEALKHAF